MNINLIDLSFFEKKIINLIKDKKIKNIERDVFDIEKISLPNKSNFLISFIKGIKNVESIKYRILFWEKDNILINFFNYNFSDKNFEIQKPYKGRKSPGIIFVIDEKIDSIFLSELLKNHFNYEMAKEPSMNLRVQIYLHQNKSITLLDIYDDRGFYVYHIMV
jgi:hypothetical protein